MKILSLKRKMMLINFLNFLFKDNTKSTKAHKQETRKDLINQIEIEDENQVHKIEENEYEEIKDNKKIITKETIEIIPQGNKKSIKKIKKEMILRA